MPFPPLFSIRIASCVRPFVTLGAAVPLLMGVLSACSDTDRPAADGDPEPEREIDLPGEEEQEFSNENEELEEEPALKDLSAAAVSGHNIRLTWPPLESGSEMVIHRRGGADPDYVEIARKPGERGRFLDLALLPETTYRYRVEVCRATCSAPVETPEIETPPSGLPEIEILTPPVGTDDDLALFGVVEQAGDYSTPGHIAAMSRDGTVVWEYVNNDLGAVSEIDPQPDHTLIVAEYYSFYLIDLDGAALFQYTAQMVHHDIDRLSDGRYLYLTFDLFDSPPGTSILGDGIEILSADRTTVEWSWLARDHISLNDNNANDMLLVIFGLGHDWTHFNALTFVEEESAIYVNSRNLDRIFKIAYPSGDIEWAMGKNGDFGEGLWSHSHDPIHLENGHLMIFDNGFMRGGGNLFTRVIEVAFDPEAKTAEIVWEFMINPDKASYGLGSAVPLANGHVYICDGMNGRILEVTREGEIVWDMNVQRGRYIYKSMTVPRSFFTEW